MGALGDSHLSAPGPTVRLHTGPRGDLRTLFCLADDSPREIERYIELGLVQVAVLQGEVIGHAQIVQREDPGVWELKSLAVRAEHRRKGIGVGLLRASLDLARERGARRMVVATATADVDNLRFYQRQGFRMASIERDAFTPAKGYPERLAVDGIPVRDRVWLDQSLGPPAEPRSPSGN